MPELDRPRGVCVACHHWMALRNDGTVRMHGEMGAPCPGAWRLPLQAGEPGRGEEAERLVQGDEEADDGHRGRLSAGELIGEALLWLATLLSRSGRHRLAARRVLGWAEAWPWARRP